MVITTPNTAATIPNPGKASATVLSADMVTPHDILCINGASAALQISPLPFLFMVGLMALELLVAFLQAYVFAMLTCMYLNDALHPGH